MLIIGLAIGLVVGFGAGILVGRKNKKHIEEIIKELKDTINSMKK